MDNSMTAAERLRNQTMHFINIGRYERAKSVASEIITKYPDYPYSYFDMSVCEFYMERIDDAIKLCSKSLELGMSPMAVNIMLMLYCNEKSDYESVDRYYYAVNEIRPGNTDARALYGYSLWRRGKKREGRKYMEEAFAEDCTNTTIMRYILHTSGGRRNKKELAELTAIYMNTGASEISKLLFAGRCEMYIKNWSKAKKCFERVLNSDPSNKEASDGIYIAETRIKLKKSWFRYIVIIAVLNILILIFKFDSENIFSYAYFLLTPGFIATILLLYKTRGVAS